MSVAPGQGDLRGVVTPRGFPEGEKEQDNRGLSRCKVFYGWKIINQVEKNKG